MTIRAIYHDGDLRLLEPVSLKDGQEVELTIRLIPKDDILQDALGDLVQFPDPDNNCSDPMPLDTKSSIVISKQPL